jgi:hypothetical protein
LGLSSGLGKTQVSKLGPGRPVEQIQNASAENRFRIDMEEDERNVMQSYPQPQSPALEDIQEVNNFDSNSTNSCYKLPNRINSENAPDKFRPNEWDKKRCTYPINNYVSSNHLPHN